MQARFTQFFLQRFALLGTERLRIDLEQRIGVGRLERYRVELVARRKARAQLRDAKNTILTYLLMPVLLIFGAGIIGTAIVAVCRWQIATSVWRWNNR